MKTLSPLTFKRYLWSRQSKYVYIQRNMKRFPTLSSFNIINRGHNGKGYQWNLQSVLPRCAPRILSSWASRRSRRTGLEELVTCRIWINWSQCHIIISEHTSRLLIKVQTKNDSINIWIKLCQLVGHNLYCKHPTKMCWKDNIPLFDNVICISQIILYILFITLSFCMPASLLSIKTVSQEQAC